jgi:hypothetical protein
MDEFAKRTNERAAEALRRMMQQEVVPEMDPILELIAFLLEDGTGGVRTGEHQVTG